MKLMNVQSSMFNLPTCEDSHSVTSSPESADGPTLCDSPESLTTNESGPDLVPANPSARPAKAKGSRIPVISGRRGFGSSESAALQWSLENRLRALMDSLGSTTYRLTWKRRLTPSGRRILQRRASAHSTSGNGSTLQESGWPTVTRQDAIGSARHGYMNDGRERAAKNIRREVLTGHSGTTLTDAARMAGWPTATVHDAERGGQAKRAAGETRHGSNLQDFALLAGWATPNCMDHLPSGNLAERKTKGGCTNLKDQAPLAAGWPTTRATDYKNQRGKTGNRTDEAKAKAGLTLPEATASTSGPTLPGSPAPTENSGQLNPAFSLWLQGYPEEWARCAEQATASSRKSRRRSSGQ